MESLLVLHDLAVDFAMPQGEVRALRGIDLTLEKGQIHGLVGESGAGKSVTALSILGLVPGKLRGSIRFQGKELTRLSEVGFQDVRGKSVGIVFQDPLRHLNPSMKIGEQIAETLRRHKGWDRRRAREQAAVLLERVGLDDSRRLIDSYPHELSGGMNQRVMIAMAISCAPSLLVADEPTTALDVTLQGEILELLRTLRNELGMAVLIISHDLNIVREIAESVSVIYAGLIVERGDTEELFSCPLHPYTRLLLDSRPDMSKRGERLAAIPGRVPDASNLPGGCAFHTRCPLAEEICARSEPPLVEYQAGHSAACHMIGKKWIP
jgi:oligopeptide/dipeptide ABC transporter ATP-binding protein